MNGYHEEGQPGVGVQQQPLPPPPLPVAFDDVLAIMQNGGEFNKYGRSGRPARKRVGLTRDRTALMWESKKNPEDCTVRIREIVAVYPGAASGNFKRYPDTQRPGKQELCFSIVFVKDDPTRRPVEDAARALKAASVENHASLRAGWLVAIESERARREDPANQRTLDLLSDNTYIANVWLQGLRELILQQRLAQDLAREEVVAAPQREGKMGEVVALAPLPYSPPAPFAPPPPQVALLAAQQQQQQQRVMTPKGAFQPPAAFSPSAQYASGVPLPFSPEPFAVPVGAMYPQLHVAVPVGGVGIAGEDDPGALPRAGEPDQQEAMTDVEMRPPPRMQQQTPPLPLTVRPRLASMQQQIEAQQIQQQQQQYSRSNSLGSTPRSALGVNPLSPSSSGGSLPFYPGPSPVHAHASPSLFGAPPMSPFAASAGMAQPHPMAAPISQAAGSPSHRGSGNGAPDRGEAPRSPFPPMVLPDPLPNDLDSLIELACHEQLHAIPNWDLNLRIVQLCSQMKPEAYDKFLQESALAKFLMHPQAHGSGLLALILFESLVQNCPRFSSTPCVSHDAGWMSRFLVKVLPRWSRKPRDPIRRKGLFDAVLLSRAGKEHQDAKEKQQWLKDHDRHALLRWNKIKVIISSFAADAALGNYWLDAYRKLKSAGAYEDPIALGLDEHALIEKDLERAANPQSMDAIYSSWHSSPVPLVNGPIVPGGMQVEQYPPGGQHYSPNHHRQHRSSSGRSHSSSSHSPSSLLTRDLNYFNTKLHHLSSAMTQLTDLLHAPRSQDDPGEEATRSLLAKEAYKSLQKDFNRLQESIGVATSGQKPQWLKESEVEQMLTMSELLNETLKAYHNYRPPVLHHPSQLPALPPPNHNAPGYRVASASAAYPAIVEQKEAYEEEKAFSPPPSFQSRAIHPSQLPPVPQQPLPYQPSNAYPSALPPSGFYAHPPPVNDPAAFVPSAVPVHAPQSQPLPPITESAATAYPSLLMPSVLPPQPINAQVGSSVSSVSQPHTILPTSVLPVASSVSSSAPQVDSHLPIQTPSPGVESPKAIVQLTMGSGEWSLPQPHHPQPAVVQPSSLPPIVETPIVSPPSVGVSSPASFLSGSEDDFFSQPIDALPLAVADVRITPVPITPTNASVTHPPKQHKRHDHAAAPRRAVLA